MRSAVRLRKRFWLHMNSSFIGCGCKWSMESGQDLILRRRVGCADVARTLTRCVPNKALHRSAKPRNHRQHSINLHSASASGTGDRCSAHTNFGCNGAPRHSSGYALRTKSLVECPGVKTLHSTWPGYGTGDAQAIAREARGSVNGENLRRGSSLAQSPRVEILFGMIKRLGLTEGWE